MSMGTNFTMLIEAAKIKNYGTFMLESNRIEGENRINPGDLEAVDFSLSRGFFRTEKDFLILHEILGKYLEKNWVGKWRDCIVRVGGFTPPPPQEVPRLMKNYIKNLDNMNSWTAYNEFEKIHPFRDLNGRVGRLLWLSKIVEEEGYDFKLSFLQTYHYQTLNQY